MREISLMHPDAFVRYVKDLSEDSLVEAWSVQHKAVWEAIKSGHYTASVNRVHRKRPKTTQWMASQMSSRGLVLSSGAAPIWLVLGTNPIPKQALDWKQTGADSELNLLKLLLPKRDLLISWHYPYVLDLLKDFDTPWCPDPEISAPWVRAFPEEYEQPYPLGKEREKTWLRVFDLDLIDNPRFTRWGHRIEPSEELAPESERLRLQATTIKLRCEHVTEAPYEDW